jgi:hypothetical protein
MLMCTSLSLSLSAPHGTAGSECVSNIEYIVAVEFGLQGHYALVLPPEPTFSHLVIFLLYFVPPTNQGAEPTHPVAATYHVITAVNQQFLAQTLPQQHISRTKFSW